MKMFDWNEAHNMIINFINSHDFNLISPSGEDGVYVQSMREDIENGIEIEIIEQKIINRYYAAYRTWHIFKNDKYYYSSVSNDYMLWKRFNL